MISADSSSVGTFLVHNGRTYDDFVIQRYWNEIRRDETRKRSSRSMRLSSRSERVQEEAEFYSCGCEHLSHTHVSYGCAPLCPPPELIGFTVVKSMCIVARDNSKSSRGKGVGTDLLESVTLVLVKVYKGYIYLTNYLGKQLSSIDRQHRAVLHDAHAGV